jgi:hypothetical protein
MDKLFVPLLLLACMTGANSGCQQSPDVPSNAAAAAPAALAINPSPAARTAAPVKAAATSAARTAQISKEKAVERSTEKGPSGSAGPPNVKQVAIELVFREIGLQARLKETDDENERGAIAAEIKTVRLQRQSLYQRPEKGPQP